MIANASKSIQKIICFILGHKMNHSDQYYPSRSAVIIERWEHTSTCIRCGEVEKFIQNYLGGNEQMSLNDYYRSKEEEEQMGKETGAKFDKGKERFDLLPVYPLWELVRVYSYGAKKYDSQNWRKGIIWGKLFGACLRHLFKWWMGDKYDQESGLHHLAHAAFQCFALMEYERSQNGEDDRFDKGVMDWMIENKKIIK